MKILFTGGGTGGHTMPALSVALAAQQVGAEIFYVGSRRGIEGKIIRAHNIPFEALEMYPLVKPWNYAGMKALYKFWKAKKRARKILLSFKPDIVFGTGGYAAAPIMFAQIDLKGKIALHEQNTVPGRVNRRLGQHVNKICLTFDEASQFFPQDKCVTTGMPLRKEATCTKLNPEQARVRFGLKPDPFTVLIVGGSQGAQGLNETVISAVQHLPQADMQWLHVCGEKHAEAMQQTAGRIGLNGNYKVWPFLEGEDAAIAYRAADMLVCRAGAGTLAECAYWGLPSLLIPYPNAFADHQRLNAEHFVKNGAAEIISQHNLNSENLGQIVNRWRKDDGYRCQLGENAKRLSKPNATQDVLNVILNLIDRTDLVKVSAPTQDSLSTAAN